MGIVPPYQDLTYDAIIGYVECTGIVQESDLFWAENKKYEWENPVYNLVFQNPYLFNEPMPVKYHNYGTFFNVAIKKENLLNSYKVSLNKPFWEGTCLKMPAAQSVIQAIEEGITSFSYDLCETSIDYFINPDTGKPFPIESIDFIGAEKVIHKKVVSFKLGYYADEDNNPIHFQGYDDTSDDTIWRIIIYYFE